MLTKFFFGNPCINFNEGLLAARPRGGKPGIE